jgi:hypothetical protein
MLAVNRNGRTARLGRVRGARALNGFLVLCLISMMAAFAAIGARPTPTGAQDGALETASLAPETVLFYAAVNLDLGSDQHVLSDELLVRSGLKDLLADQTTDQISEEDAADLEPFLGGEAAILATSVPSTDDLPIDEVTGALTGGSDPATAVAEMTDAASAGGYVVVVRPADPDAAWTKAQELLDEAASESGNQVEAVAYEGVEILVVAASADGTSEPMAASRLGDYVVLGASAEEIQSVVDVQAGRTTSLAQSDGFTTLQGELNDAWLAWAYVNGPAIREEVSAGDPADLASLEFLLGDGLPILSAYTGVVTYAAPNGYRFDTLSIPSTDAGLPGIANFDSTLDQRVPADTLFFMDGAELGANPIVRALALAFAQAINGEEEGTIPEGVTVAEYAAQQFEGAAALLGFNLDTELVSQLTGEFAIALSVTNLLSPDGISGVIVSDAADPAVVNDTVAKIALIVASGVGENATVSTRDVNGSTVNVYEDSSSGFPLRVEYGVVGDQLIVGLGSGLDQVVNGVDASLADDADYQAVMSELPTDNYGVLYVDLAQVISFVQLFLGATATESETFEDASPDCAAYASQEEAQAAYDGDPGSLIDLDQDFDGEACEDFFGTGGAEATPAGPPDLSKIQALATVFFEREGMRGTSTILSIAE